jgi:LysR family transcriptional regulator (chromosome initiation inhibitor)
VPTSGDFAEAVHRGLGWGLLPEAQLAPWLDDGSIVLLGRDVIDVPLHWMRWRIDSPLLDRLGAAVTDAATAALRKPR